MMLQPAAKLQLCMPLIIYNHANQGRRIHNQHNPFVRHMLADTLQNIEQCMSSNSRRVLFLNYELFRNHK